MAANKVETGMLGQQEAERYLCAKGYALLARNYRRRQGEIDLIVKDGSYIVFVEVKYRNNLSFGYPRESVGREKQRRIKKTALHYIATNGLYEQDCRFDVVEVLSEAGEMTVNHIENAFQ